MDGHIKIVSEILVLQLGPFFIGLVSRPKTKTFENIICFTPTHALTYSHSQNSVIIKLMKNKNVPVLNTNSRSQWECLGAFSGMYSKCKIASYNSSLAWTRQRTYEHENLFYNQRAQFPSKGCRFKCQLEVLHSTCPKTWPPSTFQAKVVS